MFGRVTLFAYHHTLYMNQRVSRHVHVHFLSYLKMCIVYMYIVVTFLCNIYTSVYKLLCNMYTTLWSMFLCTCRLIMLDFEISNLHMLIVKQCLLCWCRC